MFLAPREQQWPVRRWGPLASGAVGSGEAAVDEPPQCSREECEALCSSRPTDVCQPRTQTPDETICAYLRRTTHRSVCVHYLPGRLFSRCVHRVAGPGVLLSVNQQIRPSSSWPSLPPNAIAAAAALAPAPSAAASPLLSGASSFAATTTTDARGPLRHFVAVRLRCLSPHSAVECLGRLGSTQPVTRVGCCWLWACGVAS